MTEPPSGSPGGTPYDDRGVHARYGTAHGAASGRQEPEPEPAFEGPLHLLSRAAWQTVLFTGVASLILGVLVLVWPGASLLAAGVLFGLYLVISGILQLAAAFGTHRRTSLRVLAFISGAVSILLGLFCFRGPLQSVLLLALWIGIGWLFRGVTQIVAAAHDPGDARTRLADLPRRRHRRRRHRPDRLAGRVGRRPHAGRRVVAGRRRRRGDRHGGTAAGAGASGPARPVNGARPTPSGRFSSPVRWTAYAGRGHD
ncbi:hypothetical protein RKD48_004209 [Streptomyces ambofaciens]